MPKSKRSLSTLIHTTNVPVTHAKPASARALSTTAVSLTPSASWTKLTCTVPHQEQTNWCWCATTLGIHKFYVSADGTTQCEGANRILTRSDACGNPGSDSVNIPYYLDRALNSYGHLRDPNIGPALPPAQIGAELRSNAPVGARIGWKSGGGHFMAIVGYLDGPTPMVAIWDPIYGYSELDYDLYLTAYQGNGRWTHSYLTQ